jgi:DNA-binding PadR family transcriptional regulator
VIRDAPDLTASAKASESPPERFARRRKVGPTKAMTQIDPRSLLPLTEVAFEILLSLADGERHGYDILKDIERRTDGRLRLHPGTLYRALARMIDDGLVEQTTTVDEADQRRRPVRMTRLGGDVAKAESVRLAAQVGHARARRWLRKPV